MCGDETLGGAFAASLPWLLNARSHVLIVSPHSDDAAFSMGGLLLHLAKVVARIDVLTCFSLTAFTLRPGLFDPAATTRLRKAEDETMAARIGPTRPALHYLDLPDGPLRPGRGFHNIFNGQILAQEQPYADRIAADVTGLLTSQTLLLFPLGLGLHVDHLLCRLACEALTDQHSIWACYEDQPYAALAPPQPPPALVKKMSPFVVSFSEGKEALMDCYPSQLLPDHRRAILAQAKTLAQPGSSWAERFWLPSK